jgi:hypothetical protein
MNAVGRGAVVGLLAGDRFFEASHLRNLASSLGLEILVLRNISEARTLLEEMVTTGELIQVIERSQRREEQLRIALERQGSEVLEWFLRENLHVPEYPYGIDGRIEAVHELRVDEIVDVHVRLPFERQGGPEAIVSVSVKVLVTLAPTLPNLPPRSMTVSGIINPQMTFQLPENRPYELEARASVRLKVNWPSDETTSPSELACLAMVAVRRRSSGSTVMLVKRDGRWVPDGPDSCGWAI